MLLKRTALSNSAAPLMDAEGSHSPSILSAPATAAADFFHSKMEGMSRPLKLRTFASEMRMSLTMACALIVIIPSAISHGVLLFAVLLYMLNSLS